jgi:hypothetical protein
MSMAAIVKFLMRLCCGDKFKEVEIESKGRKVCPAICDGAGNSLTKS